MFRWKALDEIHNLPGCIQSICALFSLALAIKIISLNVVCFVEKAQLESFKIFIFFAVELRGKIIFWMYREHSRARYGKPRAQQPLQASRNPIIFAKRNRAFNRNSVLISSARLLSK